MYVYFETQMAKSIKELKKENIFLKSKCEKSDVTLIELAEEVSLAYTPFTIETIINCWKIYLMNSLSFHYFDPASYIYL